MTGSTGARVWHGLLVRAAPGSVSGAVARFALTGLLVLGLVGLGGVEVLRRVADTEAISDAKEVTRLAGEGIVAPAITPALLEGDPAAIARMDAVVGHRVLRAPVVRVKLWDAAGRVVYANDHRLIGRRFAIPDDELVALRTGRADAEISDLTRPENRFDRGHGKLTEVYLGVAGPRGQRLLFETYQRSSALASSARERWLSLLPVLLGALGLLALVQVPSAVALARRVRSGERERIALLERVIDAQQQERRRIAGDLHDGVVQALAGISYRLGAAGEHLGDDTPPQLADAIRLSARETRDSMRGLRSLLVDIYPPSLQREGLVAALHDLRTRAATPARQVSLDAPTEMQLPPDVEALLFRAAQEALRNVVAHAEATSVQMTVGRRNGHVELVVEDDGRGFSPEELERPGDRSHFGLRALDDLVHDRGGELHVTSTPSEGTRLSVEVPVA